jgi:16S rRNA (guanine966-N2)-methyltransferase
MRIISGRFRGAVLADVGSGDIAARLRPTSDKVRGAIFNLLTHGEYPPIEGSQVLDLFAGTGALGFEALSRGAAHVTLVDSGATAVGLIAANARKLRVTDAVQVLKRDAGLLGPLSGTPFDFVFLDPPYGKGLGERALTAAKEGGWLAQDCVVVWEESSPVVWPVGFAQVDARSYGETWVRIGVLGSPRGGERRPDTNR